MQSFLDDMSHAERERVRWKAFTIDDVQGPMSGYSLNDIPLSVASFKRLFCTPASQRRLHLARLCDAAQLDEEQFGWFLFQDGGKEFRELAGGDPNRLPRQRRRR